MGRTGQVSAAAAGARLFVVVTGRFRVLYALVVLSLGSHWIVGSADEPADLLHIPEF